MKNIKEYQPTKIRPLVQMVADMVKENPSMADSPDFLWANILRYVPELRDKAHCANCGESMAVYIYSVTFLDVKLLCAMAEVITRRMQRGMDFTEANKIHLPSEIKDYTLISRQTISSKLGLIAKVMKHTEGGPSVHDRKSGWSITRRGFNFLRSEEIPKMVKVFHNKIQEHFEEKITMQEAISTGGNMTDLRTLNEVAGIFIETYEKPKLFELSTV